MSVNTHIEAIIPVEGEQFRKFEAVRVACEAAGLELPDSVYSFFYNDIDEVCVDAIGKHVNVPRDAQSGDIDYANGVIVDLTKLPAGATMIRVWRG